MRARLFTYCIPFNGLTHLRYYNMVVSWNADRGKPSQINAPLTQTADYAQILWQIFHQEHLSPWTSRFHFKKIRFQFIIRSYNIVMS
jgi:hypothetical protein